MANECEKPVREHFGKQPLSPYRRPAAKPTTSVERGMGCAVVLATLLLAFLLLAAHDAPASAPLGQVRRALLGW